MDIINKSCLFQRTIAILQSYLSVVHHEKKISNVLKESWMSRFISLFLYVKHVLLDQVVWNVQY
jgi:hypothetical protein